MNKNPFFKKSSGDNRGKSPTPYKKEVVSPASKDIKKEGRSTSSSYATSRTESRPTRYQGERSIPKAPSNKETQEKTIASVKHKHGGKDDTSWGTVASWYNDHLEKTGDTYHEKVIYPNLLRILGNAKGKRILDLACGQGQFSRILREEHAHVTGVDLGKELLAIAESNNKSIKETGTHKVTYLHGSADNLDMLKEGTFDVVICILALQNIEKVQKTIEEAKRVLVEGGTFIFVLNHPSFRNPRKTHWGYDEKEGVQYRRVDEYLSESHIKIDMTPGSKTSKKYTTSFHRPLQVYIKALTKNNLMITRLEEWESHRESEKGPRQKSENNARKEIPLFMCIEVKK